MAETKGRSREWAHLLKPLAPQPGPPGLYEQPRLWAEGKDWTPQFGAHFSYGFLTQPGTCHPLEGAVVHPYDEVLVFAGTELEDILALGAEMSIELGEEREEHRFAIPTVVCVPKGVPHGPARVHEIGSKALAHYLFGLAPEYKAEAIPAAARPAQSATGQKYAHLVHPLRTNRDPGAMAETHANDPSLKERIEAAAGTAKAGRSADEARGVLHPRDFEGPAAADAMICMFGDDLNDFNFNFTWGFYSGTGSAGRGEGDSPERGHTHPEPEMLVWVGLDPRDPGYLGAEVELALGPGLERHVFDTPTCVVCPGDFVHTPLVLKRVNDPYVFLIGLLAEEYVGRPG
jgi:hypothetical protein